MTHTAISHAIVSLALVVSLILASVPVTPVAAQETNVLDVPFRDVVVGDTAGEPLRLFLEYPRPGSSSRVTGYTLVGPDASEFTVLGLDDSVTITGAEIHTFAVELRPTSPGSKSAELLVNTTLSDGGLDQDRFVLRAQVSPADSFEPNDEPNSASPLNPDDTIDAATVGNDVDHFSVEVTGGQSVTVTVENRGSSPVFYLVAAPGAGVLSDQVELAGGESDTVTLDVPQATADLVVVVGNVFAGQTLETGQRYNVTVPYSLTVSVEGGEEPSPTPTETDEPVTTPDEPQADSTAFAPGFGVGAVLVALVLAVVVFMKRR